MLVEKVAWKAPSHSLRSSTRKTTASSSPRKVPYSKYTPPPKEDPPRSNTLPRRQQQRQGWLGHNNVDEVARVASLLSHIYFFTSKRYRSQFRNEKIPSTCCKISYWLFLFPFQSQILAMNFYSLPEFWECFFFIPYPFPNFGDEIFPLPLASPHP